jgi:AraC-like DNA-binding protein
MGASAPGGSTTLRLAGELDNGPSGQVFVRSSRRAIENDRIYSLSIDPLADILEVTRLRGALMAHVRAGAPWGLGLARSGGAAFHAITAGSCWLRVDGAAPTQLMPGDVVLFPTGIEHGLVSEPDGRTRPYDRVAKERQLRAGGDLILPGTGARTRFVCVSYDYDHEVAHPLLSLLPAVLHIPADAPGDQSPIQTALRLLAGELGQRAPGSQAVLDGLIDVLFVQVVRAWLERSDDGTASWLRALRDPPIAGALALVHERPAAPWTVEALAQEVNLSRATFARRFRELVGEPPLAYLTRWRLELAARRLRETTDPIDAVARSVGYSSEYAFSRAFARMGSEPPGRYRRRVRAKASNR